MSALALGFGSLSAAAIFVAWRWLTEQIWLAGYHMQVRWAKTKLGAPRPSRPGLTAEDIAEMIEETLIRHGVTEFEGTLDDAEAILTALQQNNQ